MKKILTVLLILAVSAGALFAQDAEAPALKFSGEVDTGMVFGQKGAGDPALGFWHDDAGPVRFVLKGTYTAENHGLEFGVAVKPPFNNSGSAVGLDAAKLWGEFLDDKVLFTLGLTGGDWGTGGRVDAGSGDANLMVNIKPITGLSFGFTLGDRDPSWFSGPTSAYYGGYTPYTPQLMLQTIGGGVKYAADGGLFTVAAGGRAVTAVKTSADNRVYLGAIIKPIGDPLEISAGIIAHGLGDFINNKNTDKKFHKLFSNHLHGLSQYLKVLNSANEADNVCGRV
ncbi:hypothetical protein FACS1894147_11740 [Spirochaetia bacterium]|nr:hypothetical protein FACS1894147_11740 [Spirochaetia bacterium]